MQLNGQVAIVTGAATGIGRATALALAAQGCAVLVNYSRSRAEAEQTAAEVAALGARALAFQADVGDDGACREMVAAAVQEFGRLDILVNNAGTTKFVAHERFDDLTDALWDRIFAVNLKGPFYLARAAKEAMLASGAGHIVNVSSVAAYTGGGSSIPYCASKAALNNLTVTLARALAPKIRVNGVAPGFVTGRWGQEGLGGAYERTVKSFAERSPLGQACTPEEIAACILSLLTGSQLVTGQTLVCDAGLMIANPAPMRRE